MKVVRSFWAAGQSAPVMAAVALLAICPGKVGATDYPAFGAVVQGSVDAVNCTGPNGYLNNAYCFASVTQPPTAAVGAASATDAGASATANFATGVVSASASDAGGSNSQYSQAHAIVWDTVTFSGAAPGAVATLTTSGFAGVSGASRAGATAILMDTSLFQYTVGYFLSGNAFSAVDGGSYRVQDSTPIYNGDTYLLLVGVDAYGGVCNGPSNDPCPSGFASITDPFTLSVPAGVTVTYASPSPPGVPEPAAWAMILVGLAGLGGAMRLSRRMPAGL